eukprot:CAMPEP_0119105200 /NCGR_PEP_ID=MMETSP1180-20130426/3232_1 /TAXON_ID=3052 ORGANISM="Chlamydomonas cf sp, Strain CCMP681" /NCGR_SAMPLE_ID=MMETSP1180 /ASSEMBLY_ACC=CAM_ASM_000741 /LENGTH=122 /DNA_ID=CAMNT_0007090201 /DNA_START=492 /DNA_END=861 /DNA_ORIENTATION=+
MCISTRLSIEEDESSFQQCLTMPSASHNQTPENILTIEQQQEETETSRWELSGGNSPVYVVNDSPQPQLPRLLGLTNMNSDLKSSETKCMRVPIRCMIAAGSMSTFTPLSSTSSSCFPWESA